MNKPMRRVSVFFGLLMLALLLRVNWVQFVQADELQTDPNNRRVAIERYSYERGDIIVEGGDAITGSVEAESGDFRYKRTFPEGEMWAPVTGYSSQAFGTSQLENIYDSILTGDDDRLFFNRTIDMLTGKERKGGNVVTTLNPDAQRAAFEGLDGRTGAVAALDPETGAILALASSPSYDPSSFAGYFNSDGEAWNALQKENNPADPMLNRALRETYPPGSTFKIVTAAAALEHGLLDDVNEKTDYEVPFTLPGTQTTVGNDVNGVGCEEGDLVLGLQWSCNNVFLGLAADLGAEKMNETAEEFGFNSEHFTPVRSETSVYPQDDSPDFIAQSGIGQGNNRATPLQMAMVVGAVANEGTVMRPYMVDQLVSPGLNVIELHEPEELGKPLSPEHAQGLREALVTVVEEGGGGAARISGAEVGGKTGTAQHGVDNEETPYAWFVSYAITEDGEKVAVAVVVEDPGAEQVSGGRLAAPIARDVMEAVIQGRN